MIRYPGRALLTAQRFVEEVRPDFKELKIWDISLSTGHLMYHCAPGGQGFTKEKFVIDLHNFLSLKSCTNQLQGMWSDHFKSGQSEEAYMKQRALFNSRKPRLQTWTDCCRLYCLLVASGYAHKYSNKAYSASYFPYHLDLHGVSKASELMRSKSARLCNGDLMSFSESDLDDSSVVYMHMPGRFDRYGYNYVWSKRKMGQVVKAFNELNELGNKVCLSTLYENRGRVVHDLNLFPGFKTYTVLHYEDRKYGFRRRTAEIYYTNF